MAVSEKIKTIGNKIEENIARYDLDRQTTKLSALSSENVIKYKFLAGKDVFPEKDVLEKPVTIRRFEYSTLGSELKKQTDVAEDQYKLLKHQKLLL